MMSPVIVAVLVALAWTVIGLFVALILGRILRGVGTVTEEPTEPSRKLLAER